MSQSQSGGAAVGDHHGLYDEVMAQCRHVGEYRLMTQIQDLGGGLDQDRMARTIDRLRSAEVASHLPSMYAEHVYHRLLSEVWADWSAEVDGEVHDRDDLVIMVPHAVDGAHDASDLSERLRTMSALWEADDVPLGYGVTMIRAGVWPPAHALVPDSSPSDEAVEHVAARGLAYWLYGSTGRQIPASVVRENLKWTE
jgi:hypothetical protein